MRDHSTRGALMIALGIDNFGSGLFLPLTLVYTTTVIGLDVATAGAALAAGTALGLVVPAVTGRVVDRIGARAVVIASQIMQSAGMWIYFVAGGVASSPVAAVLVAAVLVAAGTQMFYGALLALVADVSPAGPQDRHFASVSMVRAGAFGIGALVAGILLSLSDDGTLQVAVAADAVSFLVSAMLIWWFVASSDRARTAEKAAPPSPSVLRNRVSFS